VGNDLERVYMFIQQTVRTSNARLPVPASHSQISYAAQPAHEAVVKDVFIPASKKPVLTFGITGGMTRKPIHLPADYKTQVSQNQNLPSEPPFQLSEDVHTAWKTVQITIKQFRRAATQAAFSSLLVAPAYANKESYEAINNTLKQYSPLMMPSIALEKCDEIRGELEGLKFENPS
jgi:hypothetical protein